MLGILEYEGLSERKTNNGFRSVQEMQYLCGTLARDEDKEGPRKAKNHDEGGAEEGVPRKASEVSLTFWGQLLGVPLAFVLS